MKTNKYPYLSLYVKYIALSWLVVGCFFSIQVLVFIRSFRPEFMLVPILVASLVGFLLATTMKLRHQLQTRNRLFHALADFGQEFLYIRNLRGDYEYVSPYCQTLTGYSSAEFYAQPHLLSQLIHPDDQELWQSYIDSLDYTDHDPASLDIHIVTKQGQIKAISHMSSGVFDEQGQLLAVRSSNIDITRRDELERLKTQVISKMSHEFRTPMNGILGCASLLEDEIQDPELGKYIDMIHTSGERLMETLENVLELNYLESRPCPRTERLVDLAKQTYNTLSSFQQKVQAKGLILRIDVEAKALPVSIPLENYEKILRNLCSNALKFTDKGKICVRLYQCNPERDWVCLQIIDQGIGIHADFLPHIFEEFRQESDGSTRRYDGSGIGLAISKRLIECAGGRIEVSSELRQGSTFSVYLPLAKSN